MPGMISVSIKHNKTLWISVLFILAAVITFSITFTRTENHHNVLTAEEKTWIKSHPVVRFAPDPNFPPTEYFDRNGGFRGITADYLALIEKQVGIHFKIIKPKNWTDLLRMAKNESIDVFAASESSQRSRYALFTSPYLELPAVIIVREKIKGRLTMEDLKGMKVSAVSGYVIQEYISQHYPELNLEPVPDVQTGLRKVSFGTSDAFVGNIATSSLTIEREGISNLRVAGESGCTYKMAFASRKDWPLLNRILEKGLARISLAEKRTVFRKWIHLEPEPLFSSKIILTVSLISFSAILLLLTGIFAWNRTLSRQVRARTRELEKELNARRRIEKELRESEEKFRVLAETLPVGICLFQGERIVYVNPATQQLLGYSKEECLSMRFWDWVREDCREQVKQRGLARQQGEDVPSHYECLHTTKSGETKCLFVSAGRIEFKDAPAGLVSYIDISDRKEMEESLRESEEKFRVLAETIPAAIILYQGEKLIYVNPSLTQLTGYTRDELLEMKFWELVHEDFKEQVKECGLARQRGEEVPVQYEAKCVTKNGEQKWILISAGRIDFKSAPAGIVTIFDITERKRAEEVLRKINIDLEIRVAARTSDLAVLNAELLQEIATRKRIEEELRNNKDKVQAIVDAFDGLIYICSKDYRIEFMNKGFIERTGCAEPGQFCYMALHGRDSACPWCEAGPVFDGKTVHRELQSPEDGHWDYVVDVPIYHADGSVSRQTMVTDITVLKRAEEQLKQKKLLLEELNRTLENRVREEVAHNREKDIILIQQNRQAALGETIDHIAHQWKQPLNALSLITGSLQEDATAGYLTDESLFEATERILGLVDHMAQTIKVFRDFYRPVKERTIFSLNDAIDKALLFTEAALRFETVDVHVRVDSGLLVTGYQNEFSQVLMNILNNATEAFKERKTKEPTVLIEAFGENGKAVVSITDNAGGIPEALVGRIFDIYFTTRECKGGSGIGLYLSKTIIEKNMGGTLRVENTEYGARFRIELDLVEYPDAAFSQNQALEQSVPA